MKIKNTLATILLAGTLGLANLELANAQEYNFRTAGLSNSFESRLENIKKYDFGKIGVTNALGPRLEKKRITQNEN